MREQVQNALNALLGQLLWSSGRAADLEWFQFGRRRTVKDGRGDFKEVGEYALHVQCAWRIRHQDRLIVASRDLYYPAQEGVDRPDDFNWDVQGGNRRDRRISDLFENETRQFLVRAADAGPAGSFSIFFEEDYALEVFPDDSLPGEHWRLFQPYVEGPHFVVTGSGLED